MFLQIGIISGLLLVVFCFPQLVSAEDKPSHHTSDGFRNYPFVPEPPSLSIGFYLRRIWSAINLPDVPEKHYLSEENAIQQLQKFTDKNTLTWIGQSTFLIRIGGKTILTDPFFSEYAGPFSIGPKRYVKPGIGIRHLPPIDINSNIFVGMHWGTIEQSDEPPWEPPKRFSEAALKAGISEKRIWIMKIGETRILPHTHYRK